MNILEILGSGKIGIADGASASTVVCELCNQFVRLGHNVSVVDVRTAEERIYLDPKVEVIEVDTPSPVFSTQPAITGIYAWIAGKILPQKHFRYLSGLLRHYKFIRAFVSKIAFDDFDIIHVHHGQHAIFLLKKYDIPYIYTNHWCYQAGDRSLDARIERKVIKGAVKAVGPGSYLKLFVPDADPAVIPHGIEPARWLPLDKRECREIIGEPLDAFIIIFVGFVGAVKGVHVLVEAVKNLSPDLDRIKAFIIGPTGTNAEKAGISNYAQKLMDESIDLPIEFLGFLNNMTTEFRQYLSAADLFVLPSMNEAQGLVVLEALSMGKPVIASDVGGLGEMVTEEVGYVVKPGDVDGLKQKIRYLYENPDEVKKLSANCRNFIKKNYAWDYIALRYIDLFKVCGQKACQQ